MYVYTPKLTCQWKITVFNRRYIYKWLVFHCHVSFSGCIRVSNVGEKKWEPHFAVAVASWKKNTQIGRFKFSFGGAWPNVTAIQPLRQPRYQGKETFSKVHFGGTDGQTGCLVVNPTESTTHYVRGKKTYLWHGNGGIFVAQKTCEMCGSFHHLIDLIRHMVVNWSITEHQVAAIWKLPSKAIQKQQTSANATQSDHHDSIYDLLTPTISPTISRNWGSSPYLFLRTFHIKKTSSCWWFLKLYWQQARPYCKRLSSAFATDLGRLFDLKHTLWHGSVEMLLL